MSRARILGNDNFSNFSERWCGQICPLQNDAENYDLMVLDGPAFAERRGLSMAQASDLIIMPTGYSLDDMDPQIETAYELEEQGINSEQIVLYFTWPTAQPRKRLPRGDT